MSSILVTGAAGFIGSHTVEVLLAEGHQVWGADNFRTGKAEWLAGALAHPAFELVEADVTAPQILTDLMRAHGVSVVIHLAALVGVSESRANPHLNQRINYEGTKLVHRAARAAGVQRMVFASSAAVYGVGCAGPWREDDVCAPVSPYGEAKLRAEEWLLAAGRNAGGPEVCCLRYFNVFGPRQDAQSPHSGVVSRFAASLRNGRAPLVNGDGSHTRDFIAVGDVARANLLAATAAGKVGGVFNICTGRRISLNDLYALMSRVVGDAPPAVHGPPLNQDIPHSCGDPAKAAEQLGFVAETPLENAVAQLLGVMPARE